LPPFARFVPALVLSQFPHVTPPNQPFFRRSEICTDGSSISCIGSFESRADLRDATCVAFSPACFCAAAGHRDGRITLLTVRADGMFSSRVLDARDMLLAEGVDRPVRLITFSPCGRYLACCFASFSIRIFSMETLACEHTLPSDQISRIHPCTANIDAIACLARGSCMLVALGKDSSRWASHSTVQLWQLQHEVPAACIQIICPLDATIVSLSFPPPSAQQLVLVITGSITTTTIWMSSTHTASASSSSATANCHTNPVFSPFRCADFAVRDDGQKGGGEAAGARSHLVTKAEKWKLAPAALGMRENTLIIAQRCGRQAIEMLDVDWNGCAFPPARGARMLRSIEECISIAISPSGMQLATCGIDGIRLWDLGTGELQRTFGSGRETAIGCAQIYSRPDFNSGCVYK
jgi:WD40 repeat protein